MNAHHPTIAATLEPLMRKSLDLKILGLGLLNFRAFFETTSPTNYLNLQPSSVIHLLVPSLPSLRIKIPEAQEHALGNLITSSALSRHIQIPNAPSANYYLISLDTLQNIWLTIADSLHLLQNPNDSSIVLETLGSLLSEAVSIARDELPTSATFPVNFQTWSSVIFLQKDPATQTVNTDPLYPALFNPATSRLPLGVANIMTRKEWPAHSSLPSRAPSSIRGFHHPFSALSLCSSPSIQLAANLAGYTATSRVLDNLQAQLSRAFSCETIPTRYPSDLQPLFTNLKP